MLPVVLVMFPFHDEEYAIYPHTICGTNPVRIIHNTIIVILQSLIQAKIRYTLYNLLSRVESQMKHAHKYLFPGAPAITEPLKLLNVPYLIQMYLFSTCVLYVIYVYSIK